MPPKKQAGPSKKTEQKKKEKVIEDKTFGLKNKKGGKQQKFIQQVTKQVQSGGLNPRKPADEQAKRKEELEKKKREQEELNLLFRPAQAVGKGADPKSILCAFFKAGSCGKGAKCKFSHDLAVERKGAKRSLYTDADAGDKKESMEEWDEAKLEEVVNKKHGEANKGLPGTTIICKFFLDAVESSKYGWFWQCPTGESCHYKHALPAGFVLKKDKKAMEAQKSTITLEELVEKERAALGGNLIKVTLETFLAWKKRKRQEKVEKAKAKMVKKKSDFKSGKAFGISGKEMFEFNPDLVAGDDDEAEDVVMERERDEDDEGQDTGPVKELDLETLARQASESAGGKTEAKSSADRGAGLASSGGTSRKNGTGALPSASEAEKTAAAIAAAESALANGGGGAEGGATGGTDAVVIDENLFDEDELDDLDALETLEL